MSDYRGLSLWHETANDDFAPRAPLTEDLAVDVAIVGAGYTGLWTAYYLLQRRPGLRVAVVDREVAGFGASGRNGGWCSALFPASYRRVARDAGPAAVPRLQAILDDTVDEVGRVAAREGIGCDFHKGGYLSVARNQAQLLRARDEVALARRFGVGEESIRWLDRDQAMARIGASGVLGATFVAPCAALHPALLVRGLARTVEAKGAAIYERTPALAVEPGRVLTATGTIAAGAVILAIEGYRPAMLGHRREVIPLYSLMVATEPLAAAVWDRIGLRDRETFSDKRHLRIYGQRTGDGRLAFGGRGAPYRFGSTIRPAFDRHDGIHVMLRRVLNELFPGLPNDTRFTHAWGGNLGVSRDWFPSVRFDPVTRIGVAGGYAGDGVALANLAGRILAEQVLDQPTGLSELPFVGHRSPLWETEPFRWLGVRGVMALFRGADRAEARTGRPARRTAWFWGWLGH
ncbi:MAG: FAD-dependent oxidoreductase [Gemmatimonadetes bacterium]|nr:FAD-dependent oxidoreductase [Gemmatimonadota bacterium]